MPRPEPNNDFFSPGTLRLGEIHWYILKAGNVMESLNHVRRPISSDSHSYRTEPTEFGKEVGADEINWWVSKKERDIEELKKRSQAAFGASEVLKAASTRLRTTRPTSYAELLAVLKQFAESHIREIETLRDYVIWLNARDVMAPAILCTYRVWGSTKMSDRWARITAESFASEKPEMIRSLTEIVVGLTSRELPTYVKAEYEIGAEIYEAYDGTGPEPRVPTDRVIQLASRMALEQCALYFSLIRDSLRNINIDIDKYLEQRNLISSDLFWRRFVQKARSTQKVETDLWDFKETLTMWRADNAAAKEAGKLQFAEDVASFANARGGVLVIGITDRREAVGVGDQRDLENRLKSMADVIGEHLEYPREIVRFRQLELPDASGANRICVLVIVAMAYEPVGVHDGRGRYSYPVRRGTGVTRVSREELGSRWHMKKDNYGFLSELDQFTREG